MRYGYARVSSNTQDYAAQVEALKAAGCRKIFSEKASGKSTNGRREFDRLMKSLVPGDIVLVTKLDRLARSIPSSQRLRIRLRSNSAMPPMIVITNRPTSVVVSHQLSPSETKPQPCS